MVIGLRATQARSGSREEASPVARHPSSSLQLYPPPMACFSKCVAVAPRARTQLFVRVAADDFVKDGAAVPRFSQDAPQALLRLPRRGLAPDDDRDFHFRQVN